MAEFSIEREISLGWSDLNQPVELGVKRMEAFRQGNDGTKDCRQN